MRMISEIEQILIAGGDAASDAQANSSGFGGNGWSGGAGDAMNGSTNAGTSGVQTVEIIGTKEQQAAAALDQSQGCNILGALSGVAAGAVTAGACIAASIWATGGTTAGLCPTAGAAVGAVVGWEVTNSCKAAVESTLGGN